MQGMQVLGRGAAVAFLLSVVSSAGVAAPLPMPGQASVAARRAWIASSGMDVPDACGSRAIACRPGVFGSIEAAQLRTLSERFSAQLVEALRPADVTGLHAAGPATWVLYTDTVRGAGAHAVLTIPVAATGNAPDATLLENMTVIVQQVPEPSVLVNVLIGLAWWARASRRGSSPRGSR